MNFKALIAIGSVAAAAAFIPNPASANLTVTLGNGLCTGGCGTAPYGEVLLDDSVSGAVSLTVTLFSPYRFVNSCCDAFGFNLAGAPDLTGAVSGLTSGFSLASTTAGDRHNDGAGYFMYGILCGACGSGGSNPQTGPLAFTLTLTGIGVNSFTTNSGGAHGGTQYLFVVDICAYNQPASSSGGLACGNTGAATNGSSSSTGGSGASGTAPEPSSSALALLGIALLGGTLLKRRQSRQM